MLHKVDGGVCVMQNWVSILAEHCVAASPPLHCCAGSEYKMASFSNMAAPICEICNFCKMDGLESMSASTKGDICQTNYEGKSFKPNTVSFKGHSSGTLIMCLTLCAPTFINMHYLWKGRSYIFLCPYVMITLC